MENINVAFSISKVLGWLKGFLSKMKSPLAGFDLDDVKVNSSDNGDSFSSLFQLTNASLKDRRTGEDLTDISGNKINLGILLKVFNASEVFNDLLVAMNAVNFIDNKELMDVLLGKDRDSDGYVQNNGKGLLGADITKLNTTSFGTYRGKDWRWDAIADEYLKYALECQSPGKDHGAIENQSLNMVSKLIGEYLTMVGVIASAGEIDINEYVLVTPLLLSIQAWLAKYYVNAYNKYVKKDTDQTENNEGSEESEEQPQEEQPAEEPNADTEENGGTENMGTNSSRHISTRLRKIQGSVDVLALESNYNPSDTLADLDDIVFQEEFLNTLTEDPQSFNIEVDDDGYDIEQCDNCEVDFCESLAEVFRQGIRFYRNLYILHWMAKGNDMMKLHIMSEEMYGEIIQEIDTLGELLVEKCGQVVPLDFECNYLEIRPYEFQESLDILKANIQMYIDTIDYAYPNQTSDVQSTLDEWLRYWNKQMNYFVKGQEAQ